MRFYLLGIFLLGVTSRLAFAGQPSAPKNLRITESTLTSISLAWEKPDDEGDYPLEGYMISLEYSCPRDPWGCVAPEVEVGPDVTTYVVKLPRGTKKYKLTVLAFNEAQISPWSRLKGKMEIRTPAPTTKPEPTTSLKLVPETTTSAPEATTAKPTTTTTREEATTAKPPGTTKMPTAAGLIEIPLTTGPPTTLPPKDTCDHALGIESEWLGDQNFAASSFQKDGGEPHNARLYNQKNAWVPKDEDPKPWWQVVLKKVSEVTGMAIQGHPQKDYWITQLSARYSVDGVSWYRLGQFEGVSDRNTVKRIVFEKPLKTKYIEIYADNVNEKAGLRVELYGCGHAMPTCGLVPSETRRRYKRVIGGVESTPHSWPWVGVMKYKGQAHCAATLISKTWAVTAAHCFSEAEDRAEAQGWTVSFGKHRVNGDDEGEHTRTITAIHKHPKHDTDYDFPGKKLGYDIALFRLDSEVPLGDKIKPICTLYSEVEFGPGDKCFQVGWGNVAPSLRSDVLRHVGYNLVNGSECVSDGELTTDFICAGGEGGGKGACEGDGGNGVYCEKKGYYYLVGIVSETKRCSAERQYEKLVNVKEMMPFIKEKKRASAGNNR